MSFKAISQWGLISVIAVSGVGCGEYLSGKKTEPEVIEFSDDRLSCLQDVPAQLERVSVAKGEVKDVHDSFNCLSEALRYFNQRTFGSKENAYTVEEMRRFFGKYFLKENNVSPEFAAELMKIKVAILGGSERYITKVEIESIIEILKTFKEEISSLIPHLPVLLSSNEKQNTEWEVIHAGTQQLRQSLHRILDVTQISRSDYSFEDTKNTLSGLAAFIKGEGTFAPYEKYRSWLPLIEAGKNVLMGERARFVDSHQWKDSLNTLIDLYEMGLKYHYSFTDLNVSSPAQVDLMTKFVYQGLRLIENSHQMKTSGRVPFADLDRLLAEGLPRLAPKISAFAAQKTYRAVLMRILDPLKLSDARSLTGLEKKHLATLTRELNIWQLHQTFINTLQGDEGLTSDRLHKAYLRFSAHEVVATLTTEPFERQAILNAWRDYEKFIKVANPLVFSDRGHLYVMPRLTEVRQNWLSLTQGNLMRALARFLVVGYGSEGGASMVQNGRLSKEGLSLWYDDFNELGLELNAFDPRSVNPGERSFQEANFFTFSGNGDETMSFMETFEFVSLLFSSGLGSSSSVSDAMMASGCALPSLDIFDQAYLEETCYRRNLRRDFAKHFYNLPEMVTYVESLSDADWDRFYSFIYAASVTSDQKVGVIETANVRTMVMIFHYIENIMTVFDTDRSGGLSKNEVFAAAPRFMSFFKSVTGRSSETILEQGFAYLVFKGTIPTSSDLAGFQFSKMWGLGEAQRMEIARLFGTLKEQLEQ